MNILNQKNYCMFGTYKGLAVLPEIKINHFLPLKTHPLPLPDLRSPHGIGNPSMTTVLQEVIKLMYYAKAKDPMFIRLGTSGGLGIPPGSVVISTFGLSGTLEKSFELGAQTHTANFSVAAHGPHATATNAARRS
ncbi:hypothetical protein evm_014676 [Chilo suppressalis]|nr:hypothetical protein evm_014676 [Chilo suppressalis]